MPRQLEDYACENGTIYRQHFIDLGLTVKDAADAMGLNSCHLSLVLRGKRRLCKKMENQIKKYLCACKNEMTFYTDMTL